MENTWELKKAIEQIESCGFQCEAGPLTHNKAFIWLKSAAEVCPEFLPGQGVFFECSAEVAGTTISHWAHFYIVGCQMDADTEKRYWKYDLSYDPPAPWHYGEVHLRGIRADKLRLQKP